MSEDRYNYIEAVEDESAPREREGTTPLERLNRLHERAWDLLWNREYDAAFYLFSQVLSSDKGRASAWAGQIEVLVETGEYEEAALWADKALQLFQNDPVFLALGAIAHCRLKNEVRALEYADGALKFSKSGLPLAWTARGEILILCGSRRASDCMKKATAIDSEDWRPMIRCARILAADKRYHHAADFYEQAAAKIRKPQFLIEYAYCMLELHGEKQAEKLFRDALGLVPRNKSAHFGLKKCLRLKKTR